MLFIVQKVITKVVNDTNLTFSLLPTIPVPLLSFKHVKMVIKL